MLRSHLCDYNDAYIVVKGDIIVDGIQNRDKCNRNLVLRNNAPFISCILKINGALIDNAEDLAVVIPAYGLLEYSKNYSKTSGSLRNYYRDEPNNPPADNYNADPIVNSASFKYKNSITGKTPANGDTKEVEFAVPLKYLSNFWKTLDMPLVNCEVSLSLIWSKNCVLTDMITHAAVPAQGDNPARLEINAPTGAAFRIKDCKLYVPVITLSAENDNKLLDQLKTGFKRTIKWNKYRSEMSNQARNNNLNYLIDPTFTNVNRLFLYLLKMKMIEFLFQSIIYQKLK